MNTKRFKFIAMLMAVIAIIALAAVTAPAQTTATELRIVPNVPASVAGSSVSNFSGVVNIRQDRNLAVQLNFAAAGANTANVTWWARPSVDGTNFMTHSPLIFTVAANGTSKVVGVTNIPKASLEGFRALEFYMISNAAASVVIYPTNIIVGNRH